VIVVARSLQTFLRGLTHRTTAASLHDSSDRELVDRLRLGRDPAVFEVIVQRHGAMVYRVCWRVLRQEQDAEDAFQATFLLLARNLGSIRKRASLASWLHGVARRVSLRARTQAAVRRHHERQVGTDRSASGDDLTWGELRAALDAELARLPEKWRSPLILCYLEGRTQDEAARHLGWGKNTLRRRLDEARTALGRRLRSRGAWPAVLSAVLLSDALGSEAPSQRLIHATLEAAVSTVVGGSGAAVVSARVISLVEGVRTTMLFTRTRIVAALVMVMGLLVTGVGVVACADRTAAPAAETTDGARPRETPPPAGDEETPAARQKVRRDDPKPADSNDVVTVLYRRKTHTLQGKQAKAVRDAGLGLLEGSCEERDVNDAEAAQRYATIRKRSYVLVTFSRELSVPKAGNNKVPVRVKSLLIPFSPDLDPEVVYVLPGKPVRAFAEMTPDGFETIRSVLVEAGIYPPEVAPAREEKNDPKRKANTLLTRAGKFYEDRAYRGVCELLQKPLNRFEEESEFKDEKDLSRARYLLADSYRQRAAQVQERALGEEASPLAEQRAFLKMERIRLLNRAAEEFATLDASLEGRAAKTHRRDSGFDDVPFVTANCWYELGEYDKALKIYDRMAGRHARDKAGLEALGGAVKCHAARGQVDQMRRRLDQIQKLLPEMPADERKAWEPWVTECVKQMKNLRPGIEN
jgi:RNA polymerase sigma factor (sigma-70 family)